MGGCGPITALATEVWEAWNALQDGGAPRLARSLAAWGAEPLRLGTIQRGELPQAGAHLYLSAAPLTGQGHEVAVRKLSGGARTALTVCAVDRNGAARALWQAGFAGGGRNAGRTLARRLDGLGGQLLAVHLDVRGGGGFAWTLEVRPA